MDTTGQFSIRPITNADRSFVAEFTARQWGSDWMVTNGVALRISEQEGFLAVINNGVEGMATYHVSGEECELTSLDSLKEGMGIGTALIEAVIAAAREAGCRRLFLITTNDNTHALRFYQKRGFRLSALRPGAVDESRKIKPEIPLTGLDGIPIHDEIELTLTLQP
jgi:GNAT superfamily N-acetyltransferase